MKRCRGYYTNSAFTVYVICSVFLQKCKYNTNSEFTIFGGIINDLKNKHLRELLLKCVFIILVLNQHNSRNLYAQELLITGEIRPRTEYRDGYAKPLSSNNDPGIFTSQRTRLNIAWTSETLNTYITLQDARIFGQDSHASSTSTIGIYEAWADVVISSGLRLKIGRQALKYDDNRLFSSPAWSLTGSAHDLALLTYRNKQFQLDLGSAYNNKSAISSEALYTPGTNYRMMNYLWLKYPLSESLIVSGIVVDEALQDTTGSGPEYLKNAMNHQITFGGNIGYQQTDFPFSALATTYLQSGKNEKGYPMKGKMMALKANYQFNKSVAISIGADFFSGDANGITDGVQQNFKKLYGADHTFNGYMDYWNTPAVEGLLNYYGCMRMKITNNISAEVAYHQFYSNHVLKSNGIDTGKNLGSELDILCIWKLNNWSTMQAGYCRFFENPTTLLAKRIPATSSIRAPQWAYVMLTFNPVFLTTSSTNH